MSSAPKQRPRQAPRCTSFPCFCQRGQLEFNRPLRITEETGRGTSEGIRVEGTVLVRSGLTVGSRRPAEAVLRFFAGYAGKLRYTVVDSWAQDAGVIAKATVNTGLKALAGDVPGGSEKVWCLEQANIIHLDGQSGKITT